MNLTEMPRRISNEEIPKHQKRLDCFLEEIRKIENGHSIFIEIRDLIILDQAHDCEKCQETTN
jgi:hypothetical protein